MSDHQRNLRTSLFLLCAWAWTSAFPITAYITEAGDELCGMANGRLTVEVSGGTPPYTYAWSNGGTTATIDGLTVGNYSVTVTDSNNEVATTGAGVHYANLGMLASSFLMESGQGFGDPYCVGGPFFRLRVYDEDRWRWGMQQETVLIPLYFNGSLVMPVHTSSLGGAAWFEQGAFMEYYVSIPATCGSNPVQMTISNGMNCSGQIAPMPGCPLVWPEITVLEVTPSCSNVGTGTLRFQKSSNTQPHSSMWLQGSGMSGTGNFSAYPDNGQMLLTGLRAGTYTFTMTIGGGSLYWQQQCGTHVVQVEIPDSGIQCGQLQGTAFVDNNRNCTKQTNEPGVPNSVMRIEPGGIYTTTNNNGAYSIPLPPGNYTIQQQSSEVNEHCSGAPQAFTIGTGSVTRNFPDTAIVPLDVRALISAGAARPGFQCTYGIRLSNATPAQSGALTVTMQFDPVLGFLDATPVPTSVAGNTITWNQSPLNGFQERSMIVRFQVPPDVGLLGQQLAATATVSTAITDGNMANNTATVLRTVTGSYDPNDKLAQTSSGGTSLWQNATDEWIDYTIRFQNTGTDTAFHVLITDTLQATLDPGSIIIGAASHPFSWQLRDRGTLKFYFMDILLPDSNINEPRSHGFVSFRIRPRLPVAPGTVIQNIANIYFDFNPPVITEPSVLTAASPGVAVAPRVMLGGPYVEASQRMSDGLRTQGLIPLVEPYTALGYAHVGSGDGVVTNAQVLAVTGDDAIVDWVVVELRSASSPYTIIATRSALVQRDGDVVPASGSGPLHFGVPPGNYRIAIRHRNHLGCMTSTAVTLGASATTVDLSAASTATYGTNARKTVGTRRVLWPGNSNGDERLVFTGQQNDRDLVLTRIGGAVPTNTVHGYLPEDINLDGSVKYTGSGNDRDPILQSIGGTVPTNVLFEQLP